MSLMAEVDLLGELVLKNLKVRYSRPVLGLFWAFLHPFFTAVVFYIVFSIILKVKTENVPFFLYLMSAVFPWHFLQNSLMGSVTSLVDNKNLIKESRFSHYLIPVSIVLANGVNLLFPLALLLVISAVILKGLPIFVIFMPLVLAINFAVAVGLSVAASVLYVRWRDANYILEIILLLLFYMTPVFYSLRLAEAALGPFLFQVYMCNPFVGMLCLYRFTILKGFYSGAEKNIGPLYLFVLPLIFAAAVLFFGFYLYTRNKDRINDHLSY